MRALIAMSGVDDPGIAATETVSVGLRTEWTLYIYGAGVPAMNWSQRNHFGCRQS